MRTFTDEQLMAFVDGELPADEARAIEQAAAADPALAARLVPFRESRRVLQEAFGGVLDEPVPPRLLRALGAGQAPRSAMPRWRAQAPLALAASVALAVGVALGVLLDRDTPPGTVAILPVDPQALNVALETLPSGSPLERVDGGARFEIMPLGTLQTGTGAYCREFETRTGSEQARGVACRGGAGRWDVQAVARVTVQGPDALDDGTYRAAGGGNLDLTAVLGGAQRLPPRREERLLESGWSE